MIKFLVGAGLVYWLVIVCSIASQAIKPFEPVRALELPEAPHSFSRVWGFEPTKEGFNCLALNAYFEARNDTLEGKIAVSQVVMNRAESAYYPDTICGVVKHSYFPGLHMCQFSWYCDGLRDEPLLHHRQEAEAWQESLIAAKMVIDGKFKKHIPATHYHSIHVAPEWSSRLEFIDQVGLHRFYVDDR